MGRYSQDLGDGVKLVVEPDEEEQGFIMWQLYRDGEADDGGANLYSENVPGAHDAKFMIDGDIKVFVTPAQLKRIDRAAVKAYMKTIPGPNPDNWNYSERRAKNFPGGAKGLARYEKKYQGGSVGGKRPSTVAGRKVHLTLDWASPARSGHSDQVKRIRGLMRGC